MNLKRISKILLVIIIIVLVSAIYINHRIQLHREAELFTPIGQLVEVDGNNMSIYIEGEGEITLVFMSGGGTSSPILDFKTLYSQINDDYKIAVVEKFGYGFSDIVDKDRNIDSILENTRLALSKTGLTGPYVLMPHSMSGIEALYWAQKHPDEVAAIVGLDMAVPESYENYEISMPMINLSSFAANLGITRLIPGIDESDAMKYGTLTAEEKEIYKTVFYRRTSTKTMLNEISEIKENSKVVEAAGIPEVPILIFSSNGQGTGWEQEVWRRHHRNYIEMVEDGEIINLDTDHYVHNFEYEKIANRTREFIERLIK